MKKRKETYLGDLVLAYCFSQMNKKSVPPKQGHTFSFNFSFAIKSNRKITPTR